MTDKLLLTQSGRPRAALMVLLFAVLLALPSILNGKPFLFYDSTHYFDIGELIVSKAEGILMPAAEAPAAPVDNAGMADAAAAAGTDGALAAISGGRSPVYSLLTYILTMLFSAYGVVAFQSLVAAWVIHRLMQALAPSAGALSQIGLVAALAILTPLGFHAGFVMPDIFAGVFVVAALILTFDRKTGLVETLVLTALLALSATMHTTILALGLVLIVLILGCRLIPAMRPSVNQKAAGAIAAALVLCVGFGTAYKAGVEAITGNEMGNAPYLAGRVIADGPGKRFIEERCEDGQFAVCDFRGIDYLDHNDFLWGGHGATVNWSTATPETKAAVQHEEKDFVIASITAFPWAQFQATFHNAVQQLTFFGIRETASGAEVMMTFPEFSGNELMQHVPNLEGCAAGRNCEGVNPFREGWAVLVHTALLVASTALVAIILLSLPRILSRTAPMDAGMQKILIAGMFVVIVLLANAAVCGALSGPHDRYQARVAWIAALILGVGILHWQGRRKNEVSA